MEERLSEADVLLKELLLVESQSWAKFEQIQGALDYSECDFLRYELLRRKHFYLQVLCKKEQLFGG